MNIIKHNNLTYEKKGSLNLSVFNYLYNLTSLDKFIGQVQTRSAFKIRDKTNYIFNIKSLQTSIYFNPSAEDPKLFLPFIENSFYDQSTHFLSVVTGKENLISNDLDISKMTSIGGTGLIKEESIKNNDVYDSLQDDFTNVFHSDKRIVNDGGGVTGDYFIQLPQATSDFIEKSSSFSASRRTQKIDSFFIPDVKYGYLIPNFSNLNSSLFSNLSCYQFLIKTPLTIENALNYYFDVGSPYIGSEPIINICKNSFTIEYYTNQEG